MPVLIDTNVLLRSVQPSHPMHVSAVRALEVLTRSQVGRLNVGHGKSIRPK